MNIKQRELARSVGLDVPALKELVERGELHVQIGVVWVEDGPSHFEIIDGGADVLVDVQLQPSGIPVTARLSGLGGGAGRGSWSIPDVGTHVVVGVPRGNLDAGVVILGTIGQVPDGLAEHKTVIAEAPGGEVIVHDGVASLAEPTLKATTYRGAETTMHSTFQTALGVLATALTAFAGSPAGPAETKTVVAAIGVFLNAVNVAQQLFESSTSTYPTTVLKAK